MELLSMGFTFKILLTKMLLTFKVYFAKLLAVNHPLLDKSPTKGETKRLLCHSMEQYWPERPTAPLHYYFHRALSTESWSGCYNLGTIKPNHLTVQI